MVIGNCSVPHFCTEVDRQTLRKMWQYQLESSGKSSIVEHACTIIYLKAWLHNAVFGVTSSHNAIHWVFFPGGGGTPTWNRQGCSSEISNLTPKGDHLGVA